MLTDLTTLPRNAPRPMAWVAHARRHHPVMLDKIHWVHRESRITPEWKKNKYDFEPWCYCVYEAVAAAFIVDRGIDADDLDKNFTNRQKILIGGALAAWDATQCIYTYDVSLAKSLLKTPYAVTDKLNDNLLTRLPVWCVYVDLSKATHFVDLNSNVILGFFATVIQYSDDAEADMLVLVDASSPEDKDVLFPLSLPINPTSNQKKSITDRYAHIKNEGLRKALFHDLSYYVKLILHLCSEAPDITQRGRVNFLKPRPKYNKQGNIIIPRKPQQWEVGWRMGAKLRHLQRKFEEMDKEWKQNTKTGRAGPRPHIRQGHFHGRRVGKGRKDLIFKWQPPTLVCGDQIVTTIHPVEEED